MQVAGTTVVSALGQASSPRLAQSYANGDLSDFRRLLGRMVALAAALGVAGVLAAVLLGRPLLNLLYGAEYAARNDVFVWLMVAAGVAYVASMLGYGLTAARELRLQMPLFVSVCVVSLACCALLVPAHGLSGAAIAAVAASATQAGLSVLVLAHRRRCPTRPEMKVA